MSANHTYEQIASDFQLWGEYFDTAAEMTEEEFNAMSTEDKVALQVQAFGPENE
ncbi:hypothetical protein [Chromobacterium subtsugae]|uniref:hypothetical protein n=1 Tax=Chromobacterium subtsugae TaxID=251747 RepID=UPI000A9131FB|nr:hypothetical protein [Chromobacterium subtsugae]